MKERTTKNRRVPRLFRRSTQWIHQLWPGRIENPIFVVGCPRSGTSILGEILGQTPDFFYLHEPKHIWCHINPKLDTWAYHIPIERGVLHWDASDLKSREAAHLAQWFHLELTISRRHRLVEKTPQNVMRLQWLHAMFPDAKFVHIIRHGRDVALSLVDAIGRWYPTGYWECTWHYGKFRQYAARRPDLWHRLQYISENSDNYPRCLFVWLCLVSEGVCAGQAR